MADFDPLVTERDLARTYDGGAYEDPLNAVFDYRSVLEFAARHPDLGAHAIGSRMKLPRSRIRPWLEDGSMPDAVRAVETARDRGWLDVGYGDRVFAGLNALVANVFSGGSIATADYRPSFALNQRGRRSHVLDALDLVDVDYRVVDDRDDRADEVRPTAHAPVLGRVLAVLEAPVGPKAEQPLALPTYLDDAPLDTRETFVYCYLENRAIDPEGRNALRFREERSAAYLESLATLIESVADGPVTVTEKNVVLSPEATENLGTVV